MELLLHSKRRSSSVLEAKDSSKSVGEMRQQPKELNKGIVINLFWV